LRVDGIARLAGEGSRSRGHRADARRSGVPCEPPAGHGGGPVTPALAGVLEPVWHEQSAARRADAARLDDVAAPKGACRLAHARARNPHARDDHVEPGFDAGDARRTYAGRPGCDRAARRSRGCSPAHGPCALAHRRSGPSRTSSPYPDVGNGDRLTHNDLPDAQVAWTPEGDRSAVIVRFSASRVSGTTDGTRSSSVPA